MKAQNIEVADIPLTDMIKKENEIQFMFPKVYAIDKKKYIENCTLVITDWDETEFVSIIAESPTSFKKTFLELDQIEKFDLIQEMSETNTNTLVLKGYSKESNNWIEYSFINCKYEFVIMNS